MFAELSSRGLRLDSPTVAFYRMKQLVVPEPDGYELCFEKDLETTKATL
jgi:hypothetical protein